MRASTKRWFKRSEYDFVTATAMWKARRYLYVAFTCQQTVEKCLKGIIAERSDKIPPYTHRLVTLVEVAEITATQEQLDFLEFVTQYYIRSRYPEVKDRLARGLTKSSTKVLLDQTKECLKWLKNVLKM